MSEKYINDFNISKHWKIKPTYFYKDDFGINWYLKKYIILHKNLLADKSKFNNFKINEIKEKYSQFVNSIDNINIKKKAKEYFKYIETIDFNEFNDVEKYDDIARNIFLQIQVGGGGQSGIKLEILQLIKNNTKMSTLIKKIEVLKKSTYKKNNDTVNTILRDFPASLRNFRKVYTFYGITNNEEDGYKLNQIGDFIYNSNNEIELSSIVDQQLYKFRYGNPETISIVPKYENKKSYELTLKNFNKIENFNDFFVNPRIAILQILYELDKINQGYITKEEYYLFVSRIYPYEIKKIKELILNYRNSKNKQNYKILFERQKNREITKKKLIDFSDFWKDLCNLTYGNISQRRNDFYSINPFLELSNGRVKIINKEIFKYYYNFVISLNNYLNKKYSQFYNDISKNFILNSIKQIHLISDDKKKYADFFKSISKNNLDEQNIFDNTIYIEWNNYLRNIDTYLLLITSVLNFSIINFKNLKNKKNLDNINFLPKIFEDSQYKNKFEDEFNRLLCCFFKMENFEINEFIEVSEEKLDFENYSSIKNAIDIKNNNNLVFIGNKIKNKRNTSLMIEAKKKRSNQIIFNKKNKILDPKLCDCCEEKNKLECHHIIPFEIDGPDDFLNYVFLCEQCHNYFTHNTDILKKQESILNLKLKNLISFKNFKLLVLKNLLNKFHIQFLFQDGYINSVQFLELIKIYKIEKYEVENHEKEYLSKVGLSYQRWSRAMKNVFMLRKKYKFVVMKENKNYKTNFCDGGCNSSFDDTPVECHHIIPKQQIYKKYNNPPLNGPESPYNYLFLCKNCHDLFTHEKSERKNVIKNVKKNNLVNYDTIFRMILDDNIKKIHLKFLLDEEYIGIDDFEKLLLKLKEFQMYSTAFESS